MSSARTKTPKTPNMSSATKSAATKSAATKKTPTPEAPIVPFASPRAWEAWLAEHHTSSRGIWMKLAKKGSGDASVTYAEALEVALAYGWIDGQRRAHDDRAWLQKFTPRGARSIWSKINCAKALALIASGAMKAAGLAEVTRAKNDGRWDAAYEPQSRATVPDDLALALAANPRAAAFFATLNSQNRYAVLFRVHTAKRAETREKRIAEFVAMLAKSEKLHP